MNVEKYYESHIKCDFLNYLRAGKIINSRSVVASEYVLGSTGRRADLAIYNGSKFIGIEVKSQYDNLTRLRDQLRVYAACFDEVKIVLDERHVEEGLEIACSSIAVYEVDRRGEISLRRAADVSRQINIETRLQLLTMQELKRLTGFSASASVKRSVLLREAEKLRRDVVSDAVTSAFRQAFSETSADFWRRVRRRRVTLEALSYLSRFATDRVNLREKEEEKARFWDTWQQDAFLALQQAVA